MSSSSPEGGHSGQEIRIKSDYPPPKSSSVHLLPCKVECEGVDGCGPAGVDTYFTPVIRETDETAKLTVAKEDRGDMNQVYTATFRGRRLKGVKVKVPEGFSGCVLKEPNQSHGDEVCSLNDIVITSVSDDRLGNSFFITSEYRLT